MTNPNTLPGKQPEPNAVSNQTARTLMWFALVASAVAAVATLVKISAPEYSRIFGPNQYLIQALPYVLLIILGIVFGGTVSGATISLIAALVLGGFGTFVIYTAGGEIDDIGILVPIVLFPGCGLVLLVHLVRWGMTTSKET